MKNKTLNYWSKLLSLILSFFGIIVGSFACVYGPPDNSEEMRKINDLKVEIENLQQKFYNIESEKGSLQKDIVNSQAKIRMLNKEKDSLTILLEEFDK